MTIHDRRLPCCERGIRWYDMITEWVNGRMNESGVIILVYYIYNLSGIFVYTVKCTFRNSHRVKSIL
jgi:hypothetical protein